MVHGGPWVRGSHWRWASTRQFLASRGYLVIEPEFRGSTGFGNHLFRAGWRQWGRAMQDDVADVVGWAVGKKLADPSKVCIIGASYGGYATIMGLIRHPELYRCGAAWVAVTDPRLMFQWTDLGDMGTEGREFSLPKLIGDPKADAAMLESVTPVLLADRIKSPLLLAVGGADRRVLPEHGRRLRDEMKAAGHAPEYVEYPTEGHGWLQLETRVDFARRLEDFLARNLR
jgi:dipeptidyl aminopeptidase/acylaminoacyl peptidase